MVAFLEYLELGVRRDAVEPLGALAVLIWVAETAEREVDGLRKCSRTSRSDGRQEDEGSDD